MDSKTRIAKYVGAIKEAQRRVDEANASLEAIRQEAIEDLTLFKKGEVIDGRTSAGGHECSFIIDDIDFQLNGGDPIIYYHGRKMKKDGKSFSNIACYKIAKPF